MKKQILAVVALMMGLVGVALLTTDRSRAGVTCTLPNVLVNGTVADASQVMADFNAITACLLGNIAASGANNDITGLFALTTPIAPVNGGTPIYLGSSSTGSANAQIIATTIPSNFTLGNGRSVLFTASLTNTAALQVNVASSGLVNVFRRTAGGPVAMGGGEVTAGNVYLITYAMAACHPVHRQGALQHLPDFGHQRDLHHAIGRGQSRAVLARRWRCRLW
jgi:hypothetical protein